MSPDLPVSRSLSEVVIFVKGVSILSPSGSGGAAHLLLVPEQPEPLAGGTVRVRQDRHLMVNIFAIAGRSINNDRST